MKWCYVLKMRKAHLHRDIRQTTYLSSFGNGGVRAVGELLENPVFRIVSSGWNAPSRKDGRSIPGNARHDAGAIWDSPSRVTAAVREFFGSSQLRSSWTKQSLSEITHKRRCRHLDRRTFA